MQKLIRVSDFFVKYMALLVIIVSAVALIIPSAFTWVTPHVTIFLGIVMFGMGMTLRVQDFRAVFQRPRDVLIGVVAQFTIMPLLAYVLARIFALPPELAAGVILVGTCPGGTASNVITYLARGDVALSVSMTMTSTILAPVVTPLLTWWLVGAWIQVSLLEMFLSIAQIVVAPIVLGIAANAFFGKFIQRVVKILPLISILAIILIMGAVISVNADKILEVGATICIVVMLHNLFGCALGFTAAKFFQMNLSKAKAVSLEVGMQNSGLAASLALLHFGAAAAIPGAIFSVWHNISGSIIASFFAKQKD